MQYGFRKKKSTEDAFIYLWKGIENTRKKYVVVLFIDIEGAFDNLWWQAILARIRKSNCNSILFEILKDYFRERKTAVIKNLIELNVRWRRDVHKALYLQRGTGV